MADSDGVGRYAVDCVRCSMPLVTSDGLRRPVAEGARLLSAPERGEQV